MLSVSILNTLFFNSVLENQNFFDEYSGYMYFVYQVGQTIGELNKIKHFILYFRSIQNSVSCILQI